MPRFTPDELHVMRLLWEHGETPNVRRALTVTLACIASLLCGGLTISEAIDDPPVAAQQTLAESAATANDKTNADRKARRNPAGAKTANRTMLVHTAKEVNGETLTGVGLEFGGRLGGQDFKRRLVTDREGVARLNLPAEAEISNLWMTAAKADFVSIHHDWSGRHQDIEIPERIELRFAEGKQIGGRVEDEAGRPVAGATLEIVMPITWPGRAGWVFTAATLTTDARGEWTWKEAPTNLNHVGINVRHADFMPGYSSKDSGMNNVAKLSRGLQMPGRVIDEHGKPVAGAVVRIGNGFRPDLPASKTDASGRFVLKCCERGKSLVIVQAEGFSPAFQEALIDEKTKGIEFRLQPGRTLTVHVADVDGKPIEGAVVAADTWRGQRFLNLLRANTDAEGKVVFRGAPDDEMLFDVFRPGYMRNRLVPLKASAETKTITLLPRLAISGRVTDAATGQRIVRFGLRHGAVASNGGDPQWSGDEAARYEKGAYHIQFEHPHEGHVLQVLADGYLPATSRVFRSTEGRLDFDFALRRGPGPRGVVVLPDGSPAAGAEVCLATEKERAMVRDGHFERGMGRAAVVKTDAFGRFSLPSRGDAPFLLIVTHEAGFAERLRKDHDDAKTPIVLEPWGRIEGAALLGAKPDAGRQVAFASQRPDWQSPFHYIYDGYTHTDKQGRFHFDRVVPGPGSVSKVITVPRGDFGYQAGGWETPVEVRPGEVTKVQIGGRGRLVKGRIRLAKSAQTEIDWLTNQPVVIEAWNEANSQPAEPFAEFAAKLSESGGFEIADVPAGHYKLVLLVNEPPSPNISGRGAVIGYAEREFTVPEMSTGRSDEPLDVGAIEAKLFFDMLDVGDASPDFAAEKLSGGTLKLSEFRGKLLLLDFWATWCAPCRAEMPNLQKLQEEFGEDPRFALVGLSCDSDAASAKRYVESNAFSWTQAWVGGGTGKTASAYTARVLPALFLIAPDGRVLAKDLRGDDLRKAVARALADKELFGNTN